MVYGFAGQVDGIVGRLREELGEEATTIATGGYAGGDRALLRPGRRGRRPADPDRPEADLGAQQVTLVTPPSDPGPLRFPTAMPALTDPWTLGGRTLENRLVLAPLAGIGNWFVRLQAQPLRRRAGHLGDGLAASASPTATSAPSRSSCASIPEEHPSRSSSSAMTPAVMREAAAMAADAGADLIDLNMGCPVRKVCKTGAGRRAARGPRPRRWPSPTPPRRAAACPSPRSCVPAGPGRSSRPATWRSGWRAKPASPGSPSTRGTPRSSTPAAPDYALARELAETLPVPVLLSGGLTDEAHIARRLRAERGRRRHARPRLARKPVAFRAPARALRRRADRQGGRERARNRHRGRRGPPRTRARRPLFAQVLSLVRRHAAASPSASASRWSRPPPRPTRGPRSRP